jgi:rsbT co-antagonist protein RsbR
MDERSSGKSKAAGKSVTTDMLSEEVKYFRSNYEKLRKQWIKIMEDKGLLKGLTGQEIEKESKTIYETAVSCLETGNFSAAREYARTLAERGVLAGMTTGQIMGGFLNLRDVYGRGLFENYRSAPEKLSAALNLYEPVANEILSIVALAFIEEREKELKNQQKKAILELSTPVLQARDGMLVVPVIGMIDTLRARQLTERLLNSIRENRAKVIVLDITGVPIVDSKVANHILQTVEAARLMGARVVVTGISAAIAQMLVTIGVDLTKLNALSDLQGGIDEADRILGYKVTKLETSAPNRG